MLGVGFWMLDVPVPSPQGKSFACEGWSVSICKSMRDGIASGIGVGSCLRLVAAAMAALWLIGASPLVSCAAAEDLPGNLVGMYIHQHWPYNYPYAARTWQVEDYRGYCGGLKALGYNAVMIWPVLETMPSPLTSSDRACLKKIAAVIDMLH
jgi:hypothetical protein